MPISPSFANAPQRLLSETQSLLKKTEDVLLETTPTLMPTWKQLKTQFQSSPVLTSKKPSTQPAAQSRPTTCTNSTNSVRSSTQCTPRSQPVKQRFQRSTGPKTPAHSLLQLETTTTFMHEDRQNYQQKHALAVKTRKIV